jgi:hypothetical protein
MTAIVQIIVILLCHAMQCCSSIPTFYGNLLPLSSGLKWINYIETVVRIDRRRWANQSCGRSEEKYEASGTGNRKYPFSEPLQSKAHFMANAKQGQVKKKYVTCPQNLLLFFQGVNRSPSELSVLSSYLLLYV